MSLPSQSITESFLETLEVSVTELAVLRGVSRQYATRDLGKFLESADGLNALCRTLLVIDTDSSRVMAERLRRFAAEQLNIPLSVGSGVSVAGSKTYAQLFAENKELWIWAASPLDVERSEYWEKLCTEFLDKQNRLLVYFVPTLEIADRLALRFETELFGRQYDADGSELKGAEGFGATVFIIVTNLAAAMPYVILANPGSANLTMEGTRPSGWVMGKQAQDLFEVSGRLADQLIQKARAVGLGVARNMENFFPLGQQLKDSGVPFRNYPNVDLLIGIRMEHSVGMFDGEPVGALLPDDNDVEPAQHPLKFYPAFIRAYRKRAGDLSKKKPPTTGKKQFFKF
jgi:hypothetical protein